jgi:hypothetical protein
MELLNENESDDELPAGWEERVTADGRIYYAKYNCFLFINIKKNNYKKKIKNFSHQTRTTQWQHPVTNKEKIISGG